MSSASLSITLLSFALVALLPAPLNGAPTLSLMSRQSNTTASDFQLQNALDAQQLNIKFSSLTANDTCTNGDQACVNSAFAQCVSGQWVPTPCAAQTACFALPLVTKPGTSLSCDSQADALARFAAAGVQNGTGVTTTPSASGNTTLPTDSSVDDGDCDDGSTTPSSNATNAGTTDDQDCDDGVSNTTANANTTVAGDSDCGDETTVTPSTSIAPASAVSTGTALLNRRQFSNITLVTVPASTLTVLSNTVSPSPLTPSLSSTPLPATTTFTPSIATPSPPASTTTGSTDTFANPPPIQTAIGTNGLPTVTVITTITVTGALCATVSSSPSSVLPPVISSSPTTSTATGGGSFSTNTAIPSTATPLPIPTSTAGSSTPTLVSPAGSTTLNVVSPTSIFTSNGSGGFTFSSAVPATTVVPGNSNGAVNNGAGSGGSSSSMDLSQLLTATLSY